MKPAHARPEHTIALSLSKCRSGFTLVAILIIAALVIGVGATLGYQKLATEPVPSQSPASITQSPTPDETVYTEESRSANWKTYTNNKLRISLKYPNNWDAKEYVTDDGSGDVDSLLDFAPKGFNGVVLNLTYFENPQQLSLKEWDEKRREKPGIDFNLYNPTDEQLSTEFGMNAFYRKDGFCEPSPCEIYTLMKENKIFQLSSYKNIDSKDKIPDQKKFFDQIFSTFRFLD